MRIIVKPLLPSQVYYFHHADVPRFAYLDEDGKVLEAKISQLGRFIKRQFGRWGFDSTS
jgi:hypothetical protein